MTDTTLTNSQDMVLLNNPGDVSNPAVQIRLSEHAFVVTVETVRGAMWASLPIVAMLEAIGVHTKRIGS
jgi:hypothetical protein